MDRWYKSSLSQACSFILNVAAAAVGGLLSAPAVQERAEHDRAHGPTWRDGRSESRTGLREANEDARNQKSDSKMSKDEYFYPLSHC